MRLLGGGTRLLAMHRGAIPIGDLPSASGGPLVEPDLLQKRGIRCDAVLDVKVGVICIAFPTPDIHDGSIWIETEEIAPDVGIARYSAGCQENQ